MYMCIVTDCILVSPETSYAEILTSQCDGLWRWDILEGDQVISVDPQEWISALIKETPESPLAPSTT